MAPADEARELKTVRFTEEQMVTILREADKNPVAEVAKKHKISEQTIYVWRRRFGKLEPADVKRLRELETDNAKLKRMVAEREMAIETLREINRRNIWSAPDLQVPCSDDENSLRKYIRPLASQGRLAPRP